MDNIELFDDLVDIKSTFKVSEDETKLKEKEKKDPQSQVNTTIDFNRLESQDDDSEEDEEVDEYEVEEVEDLEQEDTEVSDEEKELLEQVQSLKNMGVVLLPDDYKIESLEKTIKDSEQIRQNMALNTIFNKIPDTDIPGVGNAKDLFVYIYEHGGQDIDKFKKTFGNESFNPTNFDLQKEEDRRTVIEMLYTKKGVSEAKTKKIVDRIFDDLEDETEAAEALGELTKLDAQAKQAHLAELEQNKVNRQKEAQEAYNHQVEILKNKDVVGGFPLGKEEKPKALNSLYAQVNIGGQEMSDFDYRLKGVVLRNPELTLALSGILNTLSQDEKGNVYFDLSKFQKTATTKAVKSLKEEVSRAISGKKRFTSNGGDSSQKKGFNWDSMVDRDLI